MTDGPPLSLIAALSDPGRVIGVRNRLPWRLPADLKRFKAITLGSPVIMGRKTFESLLEALGGPLPGRLNVVVSRNARYALPPGSGALLAGSLAEAREKAEASGRLPRGEIFVIGGAEIYAAALPLASRLYLTWVESDVEGDAFFPAFDPAGFRVVAESRTEPGGETPAYRFVDYVRIGA